METKYLEEWTDEEVQEWFKNNEIYSKYAEQFQSINGKELADITQAQFEENLGVWKGLVLFNKLDKLKKTPSVSGTATNSLASFCSIFLISASSH